jgi:hypothetical protein
LPQPIKSQKLGDIDRKRPLLILPKDFVAQFPRDYVAEYRERSATMLEVTLVDKKSPAMSKRYSVNHHHGSSQVALPMTWLRDKFVQVSDTLDVYEDPANKRVLVMTLQRFYPAGVAVI